ncbi:hypothetical protein EYF80_036326 [Liparis tanakae]|uniref:Uncharacterized protein n=1 Tax=Liparis tanakae TaxID=230148 RepID=A0A4Z2GL19_9TELE|nr:hypothetical protein EYF80_036326 [Liparis tanakae]
MAAPLSHSVDPTPWSKNTLSRLEKLICSGWKTTLTTSAWPVIPAEHNFCEFTSHREAAHAYERRNTKLYVRQQNFNLPVGSNG